MPNKEVHNQAEGEPVPHLRLQENVDFLDQIELHNKIVSELTTQGCDLATAMLCGHNQADNDNRPRMHTWALSVQETKAALQYASRTPYDEAIEVSDPSETPTITVYDGQLLRPSMEYAGQYETLDGQPVDSAAILQVELLLEA